jgi:hypothetical protein
MDKFQKYFVPVVGLTAFVVGGLLAKSKAEEGVEALKKALS